MATRRQFSPIHRTIAHVRGDAAARVRAYLRDPLACPCGCVPAPTRAHTGLAAQAASSDAPAYTWRVSYVPTDPEFTDPRDRVNTEPLTWADAVGRAVDLAFGQAQAAGADLNVVRLWDHVGDSISITETTVLPVPGHEIRVVPMNCEVAS